MSVSNAKVAEYLTIALKQRQRQATNFADNPTISQELGKEIAELKQLINTVTLSPTPLENAIAEKKKGA